MESVASRVDSGTKRYLEDEAERLDCTVSETVRQILQNFAGDRHEARSETGPEPAPSLNDLEQDVQALNLAVEELLGNQKTIIRKNSSLRYEGIPYWMKDRYLNSEDPGQV